MMDISGFFSTYLGMYVTQAFVHSVIAAIVVDSSLAVLKIGDPVLRQRLRLLVIISPLVLFPLYQAINPERGSFWFRLGALFDSSRWLNLEVWGGASLGALFLLFLVFTALVFLFQEMIPIVRHAFAYRQAETEAKAPERNSAVARALDGLPGERPDVFTIDDDEFLLFSLTDRRPAVVLSTGLIRRLTVEELRAAVAHEIGHISRGRRPLITAVFLLRVLMFFNPVALMEFRRIVQEEEKICDDVAVSLTGNPEALAQALRKVSGADVNPGRGKESLRLHERLEEYGHAMLMEARIARRRMREGGNPYRCCVFPDAGMLPALSECDEYRETR